MDIGPWRSRSDVKLRLGLLLPIYIGIAMTLTVYEDRHL
ncbi:MAG: hypothetical protein UT63_C0003G0027 [Candidatus Gottesmanbacteria bacterium GW2011_GWC2_39_8]|uniref:Uncharacterized protein n=1 Tax=Candidatus Gottesmanbacteria bacterium GW2011_GWC2_39_8 TaxID=1618450 RepID=A0A0G0QAE8_9BACT|nr:MAG: hypothetical protein UT63_C0003G0027 [Candidatus Gottesmanbacteria bacterium GW2011_GWC2_39_8]